MWVSYCVTNLDYSIYCALWWSDRRKMIVLILCNSGIPPSSLAKGYDPPTSYSPLADYTNICDNNVMPSIGWLKSRPFWTHYSWPMVALELLQCGGENTEESRVYKLVDSGKENIRWHSNICGRNMHRNFYYLIRNI